MVFTGVNSGLNQVGQQQSNYRSDMQPGRPGQVRQIIIGDTAANVAGEIAQVSTITIATGAGNYTATVDGQATAPVAFDTDDDTTAAALAAAIQGLNNAASIAVTVAAGVITLTHRNPGVTFAVSATGTNATVATPTPAAQTAAIPYGTVAVRIPGTDAKGVIRVPGSGSEVVLGLLVSASLEQIQPANAVSKLVSCERGEQADIIVQGYGYALFEAAANYGDTLYYRRAADGDLDTLGAFAGASGSGLIDISAKFVLEDDTFLTDDNLHCGLVRAV